VLFQDVAGLTPDMPVLRDYDHAAISNTTPANCWSAHSNPRHALGATAYPRLLLRRNRRRLQSFRAVLLDAMRRIPALEKAGIQKFFCGPESFTPDARYHLGSRLN